MLSLSTLVRTVDELPVLPEVCSDLLRVVEDPASTSSDLQRVIARDPALAAKVLQLANSALFRRSRKIGDLRQAIVLLGFKSIRNLVLGMSVFDTLSDGFDGAPYTREAFIQHCYRTGLVAEELARRIPGVNSHTAFVVGLVHDVGKLALERFAREDFLRALSVARAQEMPSHDAEQQVLGTTHARLGGELLDHWNFPAELADPVRWHHGPARCPADGRLYAHLCCAADYVVHRIETDHAGNPYPATPEPETWRAAGLGEAEAEIVAREVVQQSAGADLLLV